MPSYKPITLSLMALLFSSSILAQDGFENCAPTPYETFHSTKVTTVNPSLGPKGIYADSVNGDCMFLDASATSDFATNHVDEYAEFITAIQGIEGLSSDIQFLSGKDDGVTKRDAGLVGGLEKRVTCGDTCSSTLSTNKKCKKCSCKFDYTFCAGGPGGNCVSYYKCK